MTELRGLADDLADQVGRVIDDLMALLGPTEELLNTRRQVTAQAPVWAAALLGDDEHLAAQTVIDLASALRIEDPDPAWWATPLGRAAARSVGHPSAEVVSYSVAGAMLGITKQAVYKLVRTGRLDRGPGGGVTSLSVRMLARERGGATRPMNSEEPN